MADTILLYAIAAIMILGGFVCTYLIAKVMDFCTRSSPRQLALEEAAKQNACEVVRQHTLEVLFPPNKKHHMMESRVGNGEDSVGETDTCAICIEPFQSDDEVMDGILCHHEYHRSCMLEWLKKHDDCPVCRKSMWTREAYIKAKKQVFQHQPGTLEMELAAVEAEVNCPTDPYLQELEPSEVQTESQA